jgi:hypothetical protein
MGSMSNLDRRLALTSERRKDRAVLPSSQIIPKCRYYSILAEAFDCMSLEVRRRPTVLRILVTAHAMDALVAAASRGTLEKMELATLVMTNGDLGQKKLVDGRAPVLFEVC